MGVVFLNRRSPGWEGSPPSSWHYASWNDEEVIILGYNRALNDAIIARIEELPVDDQVNLRALASSDEAQKEVYLMAVLVQERHTSGEDWWTYLFNVLMKDKHLSTDGAVLRAPLRDLRDMNPYQLRSWVENIHGSKKKK